MDRPQLLAAGAAVLGGVAISLQAAVLAGLGKGIGAVRAGLLTYVAGGLAAVLLLAALAAGSPSSGRMGDLTARWVPALAGGALGLVILTAIAYSTGRITVTAGLAILLVGQLLAAALLDLWGVGGPAVPVDLRRLVGLSLVVLGAYLVVPR